MPNLGLMNIQPAIRFSNCSAMRVSLCSGFIECEAHTPRVGRTISHATAVVTNAEGKEVATGDSIYMIVGKDQFQKRQT